MTEMMKVMFSSGTLRMSDETDVGEIFQTDLHNSG